MFLANLKLKYNERFRLNCLGVSQANVVRPKSPAPKLPSPTTCSAPTSAATKTKTVIRKKRSGKFFFSVRVSEGVGSVFGDSRFRDRMRIGHKRTETFFSGVHCCSSSSFLILRGKIGGDNEPMQQTCFDRHLLH